MTRPQTTTQVNFTCAATSLTHKLYTPKSTVTTATPTQAPPAHLIITIFRPSNLRYERNRKREHQSRHRGKTGPLYRFSGGPLSAYGSMPWLCLLRRGG
jgi:hypothetical protein